MQPRDEAPKDMANASSPTLSPLTEAVVERIGKALLSVSIERVRVDGHTDNSGDTAYNNDLSLRRARAVAKVLIQIGLRPENIETRGMGSSHPVASNDTSAGRTENRRAAIVVASN